MLLVPLLVGITVLFVALSARMDLLQESPEACDEPAGKESDTAGSPLEQAFPHLRLWVPSTDTIYQATHQATGKKGPDIVFHSQRRHELSDAA